MGQFRSLVMAATGVKHTHRLRLIDLTLTQGAVTEFPLLTADDDPDYDEDMNGSTTSPECESNARILGIDMTLDIVPGSTGGETVEWMIFKSPDQLLNGIGDPIAGLWTNDLTANNALFRKYTMAYGRFLSTSTRESSRSRVRISRAAMRRVGVMHDNDHLRMCCSHSAAASNGTLSLHGRIWTRK